MPRTRRLASLVAGLRAASRSPAGARLARGRSLDDETRECSRTCWPAGGDDVLEGLTALDGKLEELQKGLSAAVEKAAKARIGLAFAWELRRLRETDVVLEATLSDEELGRFHGDLVRGKLDGLLRAALDGAPRHTVAVDEG
jgi:hypothetical protein